MGAGVLYNWKIIGHQKQLLELESDLKTNNLAHAYLFAGPEQIGKFAIAKNLAHILQCENNFCHNCSICMQIEKGYHADTIELHDNGESVKIEQVREVLVRLNMTTPGNYKILLVQNIERMTPEAANALLKTLEDPPPRVKFLLTTSNLKALLATIISRVRLYKFNHLAEAEVLAILKNLQPQRPAEELETITALALGKASKALLLLENEALLNSSKTMYNDLWRLLEKRDRPAEFAYIGEIAKDDQQVKDFLDVFLAVLRKQLLKQSAVNDLTGATKTSLIIQKVHQTHELLKRNVNTRLVLENLMLAL